MRWFTTVGLVLLTGCYDFVGERGRIGFASSLATGTERPWSPELAIAAGSIVQVAATCLVGGGDESDCDTSFGGTYRARGLDGVTRWSDDGDPRFVFGGEAGDRGVVHYEDERERDGEDDHVEVVDWIEGWPVAPVEPAE